MLDTLRIFGIASAVIATGCTGLIDDGGTGGLTPEQAAARSAWIDEAQPTLSTNCAACHDGSRANIDFLGTGDVFAQREKLLGYEPLVVNLTAPQSSRVLTKGQHEGPAMTAAQTSAVLQWIQKEKDAAGVTEETGPSLKTTPFIPLICTSGSPGTELCPFNDVALDEVGVAGAKIRFTVQALGSGLYMSNMKLIPGPAGAYIEHPLFVSLPADGNAKPDTIDRFFSVKMNLEQTATEEDQTIAGGTAAFVGFLASDPIAIYFKAAKAFQPDDGGGGGGGGGGGTSGCKQVAQFTAAKGSLQNGINGVGACDNCHTGQNAGATGALSLVGINDAANAQDQTVCNQVLIRVNLTTPDSSGLFIAVSPGSTHPVRFDAGQLQTFKNNLMPWIQAERTAP